MKSLSKYIYLFPLLILSSSFVRAQNNKNTIGVGVNYVKFNQTKEGGFCYTLTLSRQISNSRNELEGRIGFIALSNNKINFLYPDDSPKPLKPFVYSCDFIFLRSIIKNSSHTLRVGLGPSLWLFKNNIYPPVVKVVTTDGIILATAIINNIGDETAFGLNMIADYKIVSISQFSLVGRGGYTGLSNSKSSFFAAAVVSYQF